MGLKFAIDVPKIIFLLLLCGPMSWATMEEGMAYREETSVSGSHEEPNGEFGSHVNYRLEGDCTFGWRTAQIKGNINLNGHAFTMETGGGNRTEFSGRIFGDGEIFWNAGGIPQVGESILSGKYTNSFTGNFILTHGILDLDKAEGEHAISGNLMIGKDGPAMVRLKRSHQIKDTVDVTLAGPAESGIVVLSQHEAFNSLTLSTEGYIDMGQVSANLQIGNSKERAWNLHKSLIIKGYTPGVDHLDFGHGLDGLSAQQLARIGFENPEGFESGWYCATRDAMGQLAVGDKVIPGNPPFDISANAMNERAKLYQTDGFNTLAQCSKIKSGITIDFFGDSITWQNGYIDVIKSEMQKLGVRNLKLNNRGINGAGIQQLSRGSIDMPMADWQNKQESYEKCLVADKPDAVVLFIGVNDLHYDLTKPDVFRENLLAMVNLAQNRSIRPVLATVALIGDRPDGKNEFDAKLDQYADIAREVAEETDAPLVDLRQAFKAYLQNSNFSLDIDGQMQFKNSGILTSDGIHFNDKGNALAADLICAGLAQVFSRLDMEPQPNEVIFFDEEVARYVNAGNIQQALIKARENLKSAENPKSDNFEDLYYFVEDMADLYCKTGQYDLAEPYLKRCLNHVEKTHEADDLNIAESQIKLARVLCQQGKFVQAETLYNKAILIFIAGLGEDRTEIAFLLFEHAQVHKSTGEYAKAESTINRSLGIFKKQLGSDHSQVAICLSFLAMIYCDQGQYGKAEPLYESAIRIFEKIYGSESTQVANCLINIATLHDNQGQYAKAEPIFLKAQAINEKILPADHMDIGGGLNQLALFYQHQGKYSKASDAHERALKIYEKSLGLHHPKIAVLINNMARNFREQGQHEKALPLLLRSLQITEESVGSKHLNFAAILSNLAGLYKEQGEFVMSERHYKESLHIVEEKLGMEHVHVAKILNYMAELNLVQGKVDQAAIYLLRAKSIYEKLNWGMHPDYARLICNQAKLEVSQGQNIKAVELYLEALGIREKSLNSDHPDLLKNLQDLASLYRNMNRIQDAESLEKRVDLMRVNK